MDRTVNYRVARVVDFMPNWARLKMLHGGQDLVVLQIIGIKLKLN